MSTGDEQRAAQFNRLGTDAPTVFIDSESGAMQSALQAVYDDVGEQWDGIEYTDPLETFMLDTLEPAHREYFDRQQGPSGATWPEWQWRPPWGDFQAPTLHQSNTLRDSLVVGGFGNVADVDPHELTFGTLIRYAGIQNFGATFRLGIPLIHRSGRGYKSPGSMITIPPREFMGMTPAQLDEITEAVADEAVANLGFGR